MENSIEQINDNVCKVVNGETGNLINIIRLDRKRLFITGYKKRSFENYNKCLSVEFDDGGLVFNLTQDISQYTSYKEPVYVQCIYCSDYGVFIDHNEIDG